VQHESKEPQGYEMRKCNSCSAIFPDAATDEHLASHPQCSADKILPASSIRPDKRLQLKDPKSKAPLNVVIDVSGVAAMGRELSWSTETRLDARHRRKLQLYEQAAKANDDVFMTFCITPNGTMNPDAEKICEMIAVTSGRRDNVRKQVATEIRRGFLVANAISLINAETALGVKPASRKTKEAIDKIMKEQLPFMTPADAAAEAAFAGPRTASASRLRRRPSTRTPRMRPSSRSSKPRTAPNAPRVTLSALPTSVSPLVRSESTTLMSSAGERREGFIERRHP
jgi:hypothetical protein